MVVIDYLLNTLLLNEDFLADSQLYIPLIISRGKAVRDNNFTVVFDYTILEL
jgi:hypothetical protein